MMTSSASTTFDAFAAIYDAADLDRSVELAHYRSLVTPATQAVLELGCGTGTMLLGMAVADERGWQPDTAGWVGLDESEGMLAVARARAPQMHWVRGDMRAPPVAGPFDLVVCCFHTLQLLLDDADLQAVLHAAHDRLRPGGRFAFDVYQPNLPFLRGHHPDRVVRRFVDPAGRAMAVHERSVFDDRNQVLTTWWDLHEQGRTSGPPERSMVVPMRQYAQTDLDRCLGRAGLVVQQRAGHFDGRPLTSESPRLVYVCMRPDGAD